MDPIQVPYYENEDVAEVDSIYVHFNTVGTSAKRITTIVQSFATQNAHTTSITTLESHHHLSN
jgi:hypothetical protein